MKRTHSLAWILLAGTSPLMIGSLPAHAQETEQASAADERATLPTVTVTATRREESAQDIPIAITVLSGAQLEARGIESSLELEQVTPGLVYSSQTNFSQPYIRGIGTDITTPGSAPSVATYVDGVYQTSSYLGIRQLSAIDRIEVLKGPQGTLYGRNATGGAINIQTKDPTTDFEANASATAGNFNLFQFKGYVSGALAENVSANLAISAETRDGYGEVLNTGAEYNVSEYIYGRGKILFDLSDRWSLLLTGQYIDIEGGPVGYTYFDEFGSVPVPPAIGGNITFRSQDIYAAYPAQAKGDMTQGSARLRYQGDGFEFTSLTAYNKLSSRLFPEFVSADVPVFNFDGEVISSESFQQDFTFQGGGDRLKWLAGLSYFQDDSRFDPISIYVGPSLATRTFAYYDTVSYAGFLELTYLLTDRLSVTGGIRQTSDEKTQARLDVFDAAGGVISSTPKNDVSWDNTSYKLALDYKLDNALLYAKVETGFKSGTYNSQVPFAAIAPEEVTAYEVGFKSDLAGGRVRLNGSAFFYEYTDLQSQYTDVNTGTALLQSAEKAEITGAEFQIDALLTDNLTFTSGISLLDSEYKEFLSEGSFVPNAILFGPGTPGNSSAILDVAGNKLTRTPPFTINVGLDYSRELANGRLGASVGYYYSDKFYFDVANRIYQDAYGLLNARLSYTLPGDRVTMSVWGNNLTDEDPIQGISINTLGDRGTLGEPQTYGITLSVAF